MANEKVVVVPGLVVVHLIPKVASASLYRAFHMEKRAYLTGVNDGSGFRVIVVRHPLDRLVSIWSYFCRGSETNLSGQPQVRKLGYYVGQPFSEFVDVCCVQHWKNNHTRMQVHFAGEQEADLYCPFEHLHAGWQRLRERCPDVKLMRELPHSHPSQHRGWQEYYDRELADKAERVFAPDMALYEKAEQKWTTN